MRFLALALPALTALRAKQWRIAAGSDSRSSCCSSPTCSTSPSARTALVYMPVLLILFAALHLSQARLPACCSPEPPSPASMVWTTSPYLRQRIADIGIEYRAHDTSGIASTAQRLTYWRKSIKFIAAAPIFGHGTGSIKHMFTEDAVGQSGLQAEVINNPHNQTLNVAIQWGLIGVLLLCAMWCSHIRLFTGRDLVTWIGARDRRAEHHEFAAELAPVRLLTRAGCV